MSRSRRRIDAGIPSSQRYGRDEWLQDRLRRLKIALGRVVFLAETDGTLEQIASEAKTALEQEKRDAQAAGR